MMTYGLQLSDNHDFGVRQITQHDYALYRRIAGTTTFHREVEGVGQVEAQQWLAGRR